MRMLGLGSILLLAVSLLLSCCSEGTPPSGSAEGGSGYGAMAGLSNDRVQAGRTSP